MDHHITPTVYWSNHQDGSGSVFKHVFIACIITRGNTAALSECLSLKCIIIVIVIKIIIIIFCTQHG